MSDSRGTLQDWIARGHIDEADIPAALALAGVTPARAQWRHFLDRLLLWLGTLLLGAGVIFFVAWNWEALGRFAQFAMIEAVVLAALLLLAYLGSESPGGKAALFAASLFAGALLALIGQTYQTGADTFELFAAWAVLILPWVLVARFAALWMFWWLLVNLTLVLWFEVSPHLVGMLFAGEEVLWLLFVINVLALLACELAAIRLPWLAARWAPRLLAVFVATCITVLALDGIFDPHTQTAAALPVWAATLAVAAYVYRRRRRDLFMLASGVLSLVVVVATLVGDALGTSNAGDFLIIGLLVIAVSAAGGWWLKAVAAEDAP